MQYAVRLALVVSALDQEREVEEVPELSATTVWYGHQGKIMTSLPFASFCNQTRSEEIWFLALRSQGETRFLGD